MNLSDLAEQARRGDEQAFAAICRRFEGLVNKYAYQSHLAGIHDEAKAEAWLAVAVAVRTFSEQAGVQFAGYVESRIRYAVWNLFKRERRRWRTECSLDSGNDKESGGLTAVLAAGRDVAAEAENRILAGLALQNLATLPKRQAQAVTKTVLGDKTLAEAALDMNVSLQAIHNLRKRGLARLKKSLGGM